MRLPGIAILSPAELLKTLLASNKALVRQAKTREEGLSCMPVGLCACIYGTVASHFNTYGFVDPASVNCPSTNGLVLCIQKADKTCTGQQANNEITTTTPKPVANSVVNIVGPKPIYNNFPLIIGPQVHYIKEKDGRIGFGKVIPGKIISNNQL